MVNKIDARKLEELPPPERKLIDEMVEEAKKISNGGARTAYAFDVFLRVSSCM